MSHVQALINIQSNFYERAANGHMASIAILNSVIHGLVERLKLSVFDGFIECVEIPAHKAFHQRTLLSINLLGNTH